jgi:LysM repeat protein
MSRRTNEPIDRNSGMSAAPFDGELDDIESTFWAGTTWEPTAPRRPAFERLTGRLPITPATRRTGPGRPATRRHDEVVAPPQRGEQRPSPIDPLLRRVSAVVILVGLLVPFVASLGSPTAAAHVAPSQRVCASSHTVGRGDSWIAIARRYGVRVAAVYSANGASSRTVLHPGQSVCLPQGGSGAAPSTPATSTPASGGGQGSSCATSYTVVAGDSWTLIARKAGVKVSALYAANGASASTMLFAGGRVCLPSGAVAPAPSTPPTTTAPAPPARTYTQAEVEGIIRAVWPDELEEEALRIARRESNFKPTAKNWCCSGLFQIYYDVHKTWLRNIGVTSASQLLDPLVNANAAYVLYQRAGGFGPWALG